MKIASTDLIMQADQSAGVRQQQSETLRTWRGTPDFEGRQRLEKLVLAEISEQAWNIFMAAMDHQPVNAVPPAPTFSAVDTSQAVSGSSDAGENDPFLSLVKRMIEQLTGKEVRIFDMQAFSADMRRIEIRNQNLQKSVQAAASPTKGRVGWGGEYDQHSLREEFEQTQFSAAGVVHTTDGQEIEFRLDLEMARYYREESNVSMRIGDAQRKDPLVINFDGSAVQLAQQAGQRFRFDLDGDGRREDLPLFASGSGYLALDLNGNGIIDSGKELFGPASGNGFVDLARFDEDGNGWIDENDASFEKLSVWTPAAEGAGDLRALADVGIGALGLAHVASPYALRGNDNKDLGLIRSSGLYLTESGQAGSVQEIDLTV